MLKRAATKLYNWVAFMIIVGAVLGHFYPVVAVKMQPLADGFIALIKMLIPPVILCSVVLGIAGSGLKFHMNPARIPSPCLGFGEIGVLGF